MQFGGEFFSQSLLQQKARDEDTAHILGAIKAMTLGADNEEEVLSVLTHRYKDEMLPSSVRQKIFPPEKSGKKNDGEV